MKFNSYKNILYVYFYGSLHIGFAALAMSWQSYHLLSQQNNINNYYLLAIFFGTVSFYNFHRLTDLDKMKEVSKDNKYIHIEKVRRSIIILGISGFVAASFLLSFLIKEFILILAICGLITLLYSRSVISRLVKLKEIGVLKIFLVAGIWAILTSSLPAMELQLPLHISLLLFLERSVFIFALTLPFDLRDTKVDSKLGIRTLAIILGNRKSLYLAISLLLIIQPILGYILFTQAIYTMTQWLILLSSNIIIAIFVSKTKRQQNDLYYTGLLDGMMIFQALLFLILSS